METSNIHNKKISDKISDFEECGIQFCHLTDFDTSVQQQYSEYISKTIIDHPEFKMIPLTPEEVQSKHMVVAVDTRDDKLVAFGGSEPAMNHQTEIGTLVTISDTDRDGVTYQKRGIGTLIAAVLTCDAHEEGQDALAFCNNNSEPIFHKLGFQEVYLQEEVNPESLAYCQTKCIARKQAVDRTNLNELQRLIGETDDKAEKERLRKYVIKIELGSRVLRCCDKILLLPNGEKVQYE